MAGLYVHIPFCVRRCPYCDFAVSVNRREDFRAAYVDAVKQELAGALAGSPAVESVFFGGGTPTELPAAALNGILARIRELTVPAPGAEVSLEANPENLSREYLAELVAGGWNRLSLGAQSFDDGVLDFLGRQHGPERIADCLNWAREAGFSNVSLDLIYAVPGQSRDSWRDTLEKAGRSGVPHVSAYTLTIESGTDFGRRFRRGELKPLEEDAQAQYMADAVEILGQHGLGLYEVSNWARPGYECRHNLNYWRGGDYFAAGCGAHGHRGGHRWWNERDAKLYERRVRETGDGIAGEEYLTPEQRLEEIVALGLRCREGFHLREVSERLGLDVAQLLGPALHVLVEQGWLVTEGDWVRPAPHALAVADGVAARLLRDL